MNRRSFLHGTRCRFPGVFLVAFFLCVLGVTAVGQSDVLGWQRKAVEKYPDLAVQGSPLNVRFLELHRGAKADNPALLQDPKWPLILAEQAHGELNAQQNWQPPPNQPGNFGPLFTYGQALNVLAHANSTGRWSVTLNCNAFRAWTEQQFGALGAKQGDHPRDVLTKLYNAGVQEVLQTLRANGLISTPEEEKEFLAVLSSRRLLDKLMQSPAKEKIPEMLEATAQRVKAHDFAATHKQTLSDPSLGPLVNAPPPAAP